jgi:hypothetical protein
MMSNARAERTPVDGQQLLQHLAASKLFSHGWPVSIGSAVGFIVSEATTWTHPAIIAVLTGALVQVFIALMRNWFTERRELLTTLRDMLHEQRRYVHDMLQEEKDDRHQLANRANKAELQLKLIAAGVPFEDLPPIQPLYKEAEQNQPPTSANR